LFSSEPEETKSIVLLWRGWTLPVPIAPAAISVFRGRIIFFKVLDKEKIAHFPLQRVGSSFIVGGVEWQKNLFKLFSPVIQLEEGSTWFYKGSAISESTASERGEWQHRSYLATCFCVTFFETCGCPTSCSMIAVLL